jgi:O-antigen/teichoic acid export membrane protein
MMASARLRSIGGSFGGLRLSGLAGNGAWGLADQALVSLTNFLTMVFLARSMAPSTFGAFVVVYTALLFASNLQTSLITRPLNVLAAPLGSEAYRIYAAYATTAQLLLAIAFTAIALLGAAVAVLLGATTVYALLVALAMALFAWQLQEFVRQVWYTRGHIREAFYCDLISYGGQAVLIAGLWSIGHLSGAGALYAVAITSALAALWGFKRLNLPSRSFSMAALRPSWHFGKWLVVECLGQWLSAQLFPLLCAAIAGIAAAGYFKAVQNLVAPVHIVLNAFQSIAVPRAAREYALGGRGAMLAFLIPTAALAGVALVAYFAVIGVLGSWLMGLLYTDKYIGHASLIWLFSFYYLVLHLVQTESAALMAMGNTRAIVVGRIASVLLTLTAGVWLTWQFGIYGSLIGLAGTQLVMGVVLAHKLIRAGEDEVSRGSGDAGLMLATVAGES